MDNPEVNDEKVVHPYAIEIVSRTRTGIREDCRFTPPVTTFFSPKLKKFIKKKKRVKKGTRGNKWGEKNNNNRSS